jgi:O-antigen ligase
VQRWELLPLGLALAVLPLGVAGQNIGAGVVGAMLFGLMAWRRRVGRLRTTARRMAVPLVLGFATVAAMALGTWLNEANQARGIASTFNGHYIWLLLPLVASASVRRLDEADWRVLEKVVAGVALVLGVIAVSQALIGWRVVGSAFVPGPTRAQGLYSHPLTFAYVGLVLLPLGAAGVARRLDHWPSWAILGGALAVLVASRSRTAEAVAAVVCMGNVLWLAPRRARWWIVGVGVALGGLLIATDNPVGLRVRETFSPGGHDVRSGYADDRLAFWHAHALMLEERPVLGHGDHLDTAYRAPYYERIGLGGFERQYEAHNTFLQMAVNGGLVGLAALLAWWGWHVQAGWRARERWFFAGVGAQTLVALAVAALTQNAFQDAEVRYAMTLVVTGLWLALVDDENEMTA